MVHEAESQQFASRHFTGYSVSDSVSENCEKEINGGVVLMLFMDDSSQEFDFGKNPREVFCDPKKKNIIQKIPWTVFSRLESRFLPTLSICFLYAHILPNLLFPSLSHPHFLRYAFTLDPRPPPLEIIFLLF